MIAVGVAGDASALPALREIMEGDAKKVLELLKEIK